MNSLPSLFARAVDEYAQSIALRAVAPAVPSVFEPGSGEHFAGMGDRLFQRRELPARQGSSSSTNNKHIPIPLCRTRSSGKPRPLSPGRMFHENGGINRSTHRTHHMGRLQCDKLLEIHDHNPLLTPLQNTSIQHSTRHKNQTLAKGFYKGHFAYVIERTTPSSNLMKFRFGLNCNRSSTR